MATGAESVAADEFLSAMNGATIEAAETDGVDIYLRSIDGRVWLFTCYRGTIVCGQGRMMDKSLQ
jgi:hypothetical protein